MRVKTGDLFFIWTSVFKMNRRNTAIPITVVDHATNTVYRFGSVFEASNALKCSAGTIHEMARGDRGLLGYTVSYQAIEPELDQKGEPERWLPLYTSQPFFVSSLPHVARFTRQVGTPGRPVYVPITFKRYADGYMKVTNKQGKVEYLHHLVWKAFETNIPPLRIIKHLDGDTSNNAINNLIAVPSAPKRPVREKGVLVTGKRREPCPSETVMAQAALDWMSHKRQRLVPETRDQGTDP